MSEVSKITEIYDEFQAFIFSALPALLATYQAEDTTIPLTMFAEIKRGDYEIADMKLFPCIVVKPGAVQINQKARTLKNDLYTMRLSFWLVSRGQAPDLLQKQGERYAWAVKEIVDSSAYVPSASVLVGSLRKVTGIDWHMVENTPNGKLSAAFVDIELEIYVQRS